MWVQRPQSPLLFRIDHDVRQGPRVDRQFRVAWRYAANGKHVRDSICSLLVGERARAINRHRMAYVDEQR